MKHGYEVFHRDIEQVAEFYVAVLGFDRIPGSDPDYTCVQRETLMVGCARFADATDEKRKPPHASEIVFRVEDVRAELARVKEAGWPIEDDLQVRPWGLTDFRIFDPTGQYIRITDMRRPESVE